MDTGAMIRLLAIDLVILALLALLIGLIAPRCPTRWFSRDRGPLRLTRWDRVGLYRRMGIPWFSKWLPEGGSWFGGKSKSRLFGIDADSLRSYLVEVRRGEWVHFLAAFTFLVIVPFSPWPLIVVCFLIVFVGNMVFFLVLRYNQLRLTSLLARLTR
jgi:glycosyl-4,4'-diaponeurosporenoate acyltransferase